MIELEMKRKLARHFGLQNLDMAGEIHIKNEVTGEVKITDVKFVWMAEVHKYRASTLVGYRNLYVAVVSTPDWRKGVLLVPAEARVMLKGERVNYNLEKFTPTDEEFIGGDALPALDLAHDPIEDTLQCVDLTSSHYPKNVISEQAHRFDLLIRTPVIRTDLRIETGFYQEEYPNTYIWGAVSSVIETLRKQYNRADIDEFFKWQRP